MMNSDETIFSARSIARACWRHSNTIRDVIASGCQGGGTSESNVTHVLTGPKCPLTRPTSSSKILCQNLVSNLPWRRDVVVTAMASWPPPSRI